MLQCSSPSVYCGAITAKTLSGSTYTYTLANCNYTGGTITATVTTTKNPPYNRWLYDSYGMYKSDLFINPTGLDYTSYHPPSAASSPGADAWSLRRIISPLGSTISIGYEPNVVNGSIVANDLPINVPASSDQAGGAPITKVKFNLFFAQSTFFPAPVLISNVQPGMQGNLILRDGYPVCCPGGTIEESSGLLPFTIASVDPDGTVHATISPGFTPHTSNGIIDGSLVFINNAVNFACGGSRVKSIAVQNNATSEVYTTSYGYNVPNSSLSSGVTSYSAAGMHVVDLAYQAAYQDQLVPIYSMARDLPPPGAMYQYVTVTKQIQNPDEGGTVRTLPGSTQYQFEVFRNNMVGRIEVNSRQSGVYSGLNQYTRYYAMDKFTSCLGNVKRIVQYDNKGNILSETINHYLHDNLIGESLQNFMTDYKNLLSQYAYQGDIQERYAEVKQVNNKTTGDISAKATISAREEFPAIQTGQTMINYVDGTQTTSQNLAFDFYSGAVTTTLETDAYGNSFRTENVPAYRLSQYASMGVKINNPNGPSWAYANMLTQVAEKRMYKVDGSNNSLGLVSASASTWSNIVPSMGPDGTMYTQNGGAPGNVWRPQYTYDWMPTNQTSDGLTPVASFADFNFAAPTSSDSRWVKSAELTLYDVYSKSLEGRDVNGHYGATHFNYGEQKVILTGGPANYYEIAYSGAEDAAITNPSSSFILHQAGTVTTAAAHTGSSSLLVNPGSNTAFLYSVPIVSSGNGGVIAGRNYTASVWVKPVTGSASNVNVYYQVNGTNLGSSSSSVSNKTAGGWTLVNLSIPGSQLTAGGTLKVFCENDHATAQAYVDDFRFQPLNASTTAYVYDLFSGELTDILDNANLYTRFEYDAMGRLVHTYKEKLSIGEFKTKQYAYNYAAPQYGSAALNTTYYKNNCPLSYNGTGVTVNYPPGAYTSFLSQADANAKSYLYGQDYANVNGTCTCAPQFTWAGGITPTLYEVPMSGTRVNFTYVFTWPTGTTAVNIGQLNGICSYPIASRTVPITEGSTVYNVITSTTGAVQVQWVSGPQPTGGTTIGMSGVYDTQVNLFYSAAESGTFTRNNCPSGQQGSSVTYSVPAYQYAATDQTSANNLAIAAVTAYGQNNANSSGTCNIVCSFNWASGVTGFTASITEPTSSTVNYDFVFPSPNTSYTGGTIGTIVGACVPTSTVTFNVTDNITSTRHWNVTITPAGVVSVLLTSGGSVTSQTPPIEVKGSFNH